MHCAWFREVARSIELDGEYRVIASKDFDRIQRRDDLIRHNVRKSSAATARFAWPFPGRGADPSRLCRGQFDYERNRAASYPFTCWYRLGLILPRCARA